MLYTMIYPKPKTKKLQNIFLKNNYFNELNTNYVMFFIFYLIYIVLKQSIIHIKHLND